MTIFSYRFPKNIPYLCVAFGGSFIATLWLTIMIVEEYLGRPSSTHAIGFVTGPIYVAMFTVLFYGIGLLFRVILSKFVVSKTLTSQAIRLIHIGLLCCILSAFILGVALNEVREFKERPHVILDSGRIFKLSSQSVNSTNRNVALLVYSTYGEIEGKTVPLSWNERYVVFTVSSNNVLTISNDKGIAVIANLDEFDYIGRVYAVPITLGSTHDKGLAVLVNLRATSGRSLLIIYDAAGTPIYQELLKRSRRNEMYTIAVAPHGEYLYVDVDKPIFYAYGGQTQR